MAKSNQQAQQSEQSKQKPEQQAEQGKEKRDPKDSYDPSDRIEVSRNAVERNLPQNNQPAKPVRNWKVSLPNQDPVVVKAVDADEAWARFCDGRRRWPSPRTSGRKVELVEDESEKEPVKS